MRLWRCQRGEATCGGDFRWTDSGACGPGIYAMLSGDRPMRKYYTQMGENTFSFEVPDDKVKVIRNIKDYWAIRQEIYRWQQKGYSVFICKHKGIGIPTSKQIVITEPAVISNVILVN